MISALCCRWATGLHTDSSPMTWSNPLSLCNSISCLTTWTELNWYSLSKVPHCQGSYSLPKVIDTFPKARTHCAFICSKASYRHKCYTAHFNDTRIVTTVQLVLCVALALVSAQPYWHSYFYAEGVLLHY